MSFSTLLLPQDNAGIGVAFTDRLDGVSCAPYDSFNLGRVGHDHAENVAENFRLLAERTGCEAIAITDQVHGADVVEITASSPLASDTSFVDDGTCPTPIADAMVTQLADVGLAIRMADCVPILIADVGGTLIAAVHAGRIGLLAGVLDNTIKYIKARGAGNLKAWIGPHIGPECYEIPVEMAEEAWEQLPSTWAVTAEGTPSIDIGHAVEEALKAEGIEVVRLDPCTACDSRFFSHRRDLGATGRHVGMIWRSTTSGRVNPPPAIP